MTCRKIVAPLAAVVTIRGMIKRTHICLLATIAFTLVSNAQTLKWSYTNDLPTSLTNTLPTTVVSSLNDGAGGSVFLFQASTFIVIPFPSIGPLLQRVVWLNKSGEPIFTNDFGAGGVTSVSLVRLEKNQLTVMLSGFDILHPPSFNILRRYTFAHGTVTEKDTPLEINERVLLNNGFPPAELNDKTGFFTFASHLPTSPEFVIRRYGK
jgi:hypothetical protein